MFISAFSRAGVPLLIAGTLSLFGIRVASYLLAALLFLLGGGFLWSSLQVPFPVFLLSWFFAAMFMTPAVLIAREQVRRRRE
jgi:hypothetical protein